MSVLDRKIIQTDKCNAVFTTYKIPQKAGIYYNKIYINVCSQIIDDNLLNELIEYNATNKFIKNIIYFSILDSPDPNNPATWVVKFSPSLLKWTTFANKLVTLSFDFAFIDNEITADYFIPCNSVVYIFVGATQNFKLFENDNETTMDILNNSLPNIQILMFNHYGKVQMSENCINFTNKLIRRNVKFIN